MIHLTYHHVCDFCGATIYREEYPLTHPFDTVPKPVRAPGCYIVPWQASRSAFEELYCEKHHTTLALTFDSEGK